MPARARIGLVFGGASVEHEVSVVSARGVLGGFDRTDIECLPIGVTAEGRWLPPEIAEPLLRGDATRVESPESDLPRIEIDPGGDGLVVIGPGRRRDALGAEVVFPLVHGWGGEDGRIQGMLDLAGIPCVGAGILGSAVAMDKATSRALFERHGLPVGPWESFRGEAYRDAPGAIHARLGSRLGFPMFVKPSSGGSSVGISRVATSEGLAEGIREALRCDDKVVAEKALDAREVECAVLGNEAPEASVPGEIIPSREFYDYRAKYEDGTSELLIPAPLDSSTTEAVRRLAVEGFRVLGLAGMARVDFFVERSTEQVYLNEINTLPGFTPISMFPKLWEASGLPYPEMLERLVKLARERWGLQRQRATRRTS